MLCCLMIPVMVRSAAEGEVMTSPPVPYKTYTFTPGKLTGKEFFLEQEKLRCRELSFEQFLLFPKPKETVDLRISLRGGYRAHDLFGHDDFEPKEAKGVATGWVPLASGHFLIFPGRSKAHLPKWIPERTRLIRVPLIKQYEDTLVNAYDLALALNRFNKGDVKPIDFQLTPATDDNGRVGVRLTPAKPLIDGVYYAYSLPDDKDTANYGFLFVVGNPALGAVNAQPEVDTSTVYRRLDADMATRVMDYALLSQAVYKAPFHKPVGEWTMLDADFNCPAGINLTSLACSWRSAKLKAEGDRHGFSGQAYLSENTKSIVIAFRGTDDWRDLLADYGNAYLNGEPAQYYDALKFARLLMEAVDKARLGYKIIMTGHSLGGGLASYASIKLNRPSVSAVVFNAAGLGDGFTTEIKTSIDARISEIKRRMSEGLSTEFHFLNDTLDTLISEAKLGINIASVTNIRLVGDPVALFPGNQAGISFLLTVPTHFVWYDDSDKRIQKFSTLASFVKFLGVDTAFLPGVNKVIPDGWFAPLVGDANNTKLLISDYTKLLADHKGIDVRSLPVEPHFMINVINALKAKAVIQ